MDQELYNTYFQDPKRWIKKSRELMISAHYLVYIQHNLYRDGKDSISNYSPALNRHPFEAWHSVSSSASLLIGFALENALKAHLIDKKVIYINDKNKVVGLDGSHNLISMLEESDYEPSKNEVETIELLTFQLQSLSRYHLARNLKKQSEFTGRVDNPMTYYSLATKIILAIASDEIRDLFLNSAGEYDHIPNLPEFKAV